MAITTAERNSIFELTALMFNAAPGTTYLAQIVDLYETSHSLQTLANQLATTAAFKSLHANFETAEEFAASFLTPLGLQNDDVAKQFVIAKMNAGVSKGQIAYEGYQELLKVPDTAANQYSAAKAVVVNKGDVAEYYTITVGGAALDLSTLQSQVASVTADPATVTAAETAISNASGQTFTLTSAADTFTGTANSDTFNATLPFSGGAISSTATLTAGDNLKGGAGTDTLNITVSGSSLGSAYTATPQLTGIEKVLVSNSESDAGASNNVTIDLSLTDSALTTIGTSGSTNVNADTLFIGVGKLANVQMAGKGDVSVAYATGVDAGTADTVYLTTNGVGTDATARSTFTVANNAVETLAITSASASNFLSLADTGLKTVTVAGDTAINVALNGATNTLITSVDASAATGAVTINADGLTLANITVLGGAGSADTFATDKDVTASSKLSKVTGFETLAFDASSGTQAVTLDAAVAGVSTIDLSAATKQTLTLATGYTGNTTVKVGSTTSVDSVTNTANVNLTVTGSAAAFNAVTIAGGTGTDSLQVTADGTASVSLASVKGVESMTILANTTDATKVADFTVAGSSDLVVGSGKTLTIDASALTSSSASLKFVGTSETDGHFAITGGAGNDSITGGNGGDTIVSGAGADSITAGTGADSINGGDGNDTINMGGNLTSADTIDGGAGTDTLVVDSVASNAFANVTNIENVQFSASATSITLAAPLTTAAVTLDLSNAAAQTLTLATGYTGDTTVKVGATGADSVVNTANVALTVTGAVTNFNNDVITGGTGTDKLTMTADGGTASLANVTKVEAINVNASSTLGQGATLTGVTGLAAGKTMTVDASALTDSTAAFSLTTGAAVANSAMVITGGAGNDTINWSSSAANTTVNGGAGVDSLTAGTGIDSISGGDGNDTINMGAANLTFDDTIDGGAGTDTLISATTGTIGAAGEFAHVSNMETLKLTGTGGTASIGSSTPGFTTFDFTTNTAQTLTINPGFASAVTVNVKGNGTGGDTITNTAGVALTVKGNLADIASDTITGGSGVDTLNLTADNTGVTLTANITKIEQINVLANATASTATGTITLDAANVASGKTLTIDASALTDSSAVFTLDGHNVASTGSLVITGGAASDSIIGGAGVDTINGGAGSDLIDSKAGNDVLTGGAGDDVFAVNSNANKLTFATVTDMTAGDALKIDVAHALASVAVPTKLTLNAQATLSDYIDAAAASSTANTNAVVNWFQYGGNTYVVSDDNSATSFVAGSDKIIQLNGLVDLSSSNITANGTTVYWQVGAQTAISAPIGAVSATGSAGADALMGTTGNDTFTFATANFTSTDTVVGGAGSDKIVMSDAATVVDADFTHVSSVETLQLAAGTNAVELAANASTAGVTTVNADALGDAEVLTLTGSKAGVTVSLVTGDLDANAYTAALTVNATTGTNVIIGGTGADTIGGGTGVDSITGGAGADSVTAGEGADTVVIGSGQDVVSLTETAAAADSVVYSTAFAAGNANAATITGFANGAGADTFDVGFALGHGTATFAAGTGATATIAASAPVTVADNGTTTADTGVVFLLSGANDQLAAGTTVSNAVANAVTALTSGADFAAANVAVGASLVVVMDDGTNSFVFHYVADATNATTTAADLELIAVINGVADAGSFLTGDFI